MIKRFDMVRLKTTKRVAWLSGPSSAPTDPHGVWTVVAGVAGTTKLLLAKGETTIQIPSSDVEKVGDYNIDNAIRVVKEVRTKKDFERYKIKGE